MSGKIASPRICYVNYVFNSMFSITQTKLDIAKALAFKKMTHQMDQTAQGVRSVTDDLKVKIGILDAQIKADKKSKEEFERYLKQLTDRRDELLKRMENNGAYVQQFDSSSAQAAYRKMTEDIGQIYEKAVEGHSKGMKMLEKEFGYHPAFKRPGDTFTGRPFKPMKP